MAEADSFLIEKLREGSREAFLGLYEKYVPLVYNYALSLVKDEDSAREVVQECFVKVWESRRRILPAGNFPAYLYVIARNAVLNEIRRKNYAAAFAKSNLYEIEQLTSPYPDEPLKKADNEIVLESVYDIVSKMPEAMRKIFLLRYREEMPVPDIALYLGISRKTVETQLARAVKLILKNKSKFL